jgi:glycosyltransferase involved in cell wall biosynthesis
MLAYSEYFYDARIKAYVRSIERCGGIVDIISLKTNMNGDEVSKQGNVTYYYLNKKYQGDSILYYLWSYIVFFLFAFITLSILSIKKRYTAIHIHNMPNIIIFTALISRIMGAKLILDVHDLMTVNYMAKYGVAENNIFVKCLKLEQKISASFASHILCADHMQKEYLIDTCNISRKKITVMLNLPNEEIFKPVDNVEDDGLFKIIYHGTIAKRLGIDILLRAISLVDRDVPMRLYIYGAGDYLGEATRLANELNISERVYFSKAFFPTEKIPEMVRDKQLGLIGNRKSMATDRYMLPVKLLEYVYLGIPVVAPRLEIIKSYFDETMIQYYEAEDVNELAKCIVDLRNNAFKRKALSKRAYTFYDKHSWMQQSKDYMRLLSEKSN